MKKQRTHYDKAFKENAVKLSFECKNLSELAHELGVEPLLLYPWRKEYQEKSSLSFPCNGVQYISEEAKKLTGKSGSYRTVFILAPIKTQTVALNFIACTDAETNNYAVVQIGTQTWMAENLKTTKYNDDDSIPNVANGNEWAALTTPAYCWYNNDTVFLKPSSYGALYNWYAVNTGKLCPTDWHVPTDTVWTILTTYLGGETVAGGKLKETGATHWTGTSAGCDNSSGFTAPGGGWRNDYVFYYGGYGAMWWSSSSANATDAWYRGMYYFNNSVERKTNKKSYGLSVRCIKD